MALLQIQASGQLKRINKGKYDFGFDRFNLKDFYAAEAALTFAMIAYNLMALFRTFVVQENKKNIVDLAVQEFCNWRILRAIRTVDCF
jgi:hypothetical protein